MNRKFRAMAMIPVAALAALGPFSASFASDDVSTDRGLLAFVLRNDTVLARVAENCQDVSVTRAAFNGRMGFTIKAECAIKDGREENADCSAYRIDASGTIDSPAQATVRHLMLDLRCSA